jgi:hypothetical protein
MQLVELLSKSEDRYLNSQEIGILQTFVTSLPTRLAVYRHLRDREEYLLQTVADQVDQELPSADQQAMEKAITSLMLVLRYCAMAVLMNNDEAFLKQRVLRWLEQVNTAYDLRRINEVIYRCLNQVINREFTSAELALLQPLLTTAQVTLIY